jgi:hypothetical protein
MNKFRMTKVAGIVTAVSMIPLSASAALPTAATTAFTSIMDDGLALVDLAWPLAIALTSAVIVIGLFKKYAKKAAG